MAKNDQVLMYFRGIPIDEVFTKIANGDEGLKAYFLKYIEGLEKEVRNLRTVIDTQWFAK